jgi:hypothetical protein
MELGLWVMGLIIAIDLVIVAAILHWGSKHDTHTSIRSVESSRAVQTLIAQRESASQSAAETPQPEPSGDDA